LNDKGYQPGSGKSFTVRHDDQWHEYEVILNYDHPLEHIRFDPCTGAGQLDIDWIRLKESNGKLVREWRFEAP